ncbi:hypothetical protein [Nocardia sp. NPDC057353]|uniref:hypothetical protein n=1 Tax=Nocardia sp. NPDC057353 TaxID=3346104 RepID=UPI0036287F7E
MKYSKFAATALLAAAATGIASGTSYAAPVPAPAEQQQATSPSVQGQDKGIDYAVALADAGKSIVTTVTGGAFSLDADGQAVTLTNAAGEVVTSIPLSGKAQGQEVAIGAAVAADGSSLTLTPVAGSVGGIKDISSQDWFFAELQRASLGAAVGAVIGALLGLIGIVTIIPGAVIGGVIGLLVAGGPSLLNAGAAYFSGQP